MLKKILFMAAIAVCCAGVTAASGESAAAKKLNTDADATLELFVNVKGTKDILKKAKGVLVFPCVFKVGIGLGGEYGEGVLRIKGKTAGFYNTFAGSIGLQLGAQKKSIVIAFMKDEALKQFRESSGWKIGADVSIAVITLGAGGFVDSSNYDKPVIAFVFDQQGLMYNVTLEGAKITEIKK